MFLPFLAGSVPVAQHEVKSVVQDTSFDSVYIPKLDLTIYDYMDFEHASVTLKESWKGERL